MSDVIKTYFNALMAAYSVKPILISRLQKLPILKVSEQELFLKTVNNVTVAKSEFIGGKQDYITVQGSTDPIMLFN